MILNKKFIFTFVETKYILMNFETLVTEELARINDTLSAIASNSKKIEDLPPYVGNLPSGGQVPFTSAGKTYKIDPKSAIDAAIDAQIIGSTNLGSLTPLSTIPATINVHGFATETGTYTNCGGLVVPINTFAFLSRVDGVWGKSETSLDVSGKVNVSDVIDNLTSTDTAKPLSAKQGHILDGKVLTLYNSIGEPILKSYPKDFSILTSTATSPSNGWINNTPITVQGTLKTLRIKGDIGATIQPFVYSITGTEGAWVYTEIHAFTPFTTTALIHTEAINDTYIVGVGKFIGFKSNANIYYTTSGSAFSTLQPITQPQTYGIDFIINENITTGLKQQVESLETQQIINTADILALQNIVGQDDILTSYPKDFTPIVTLVNSPSAIWINKRDLTARGKLHSFRVKAPIGATITPYAYTVVGTSGSLTFTENHAFTPFVTTAEIHTETIEDDYVVEIGQLIGYKSSTGIYYLPGAGDISYTVGIVATDTHRFAYDFVINENTTYGLIDRVTALEEESITEVVLKPVILYRNTLASLSGLTAPNWSISGGSAVPSAIGVANSLFLDNLYNIVPRKMNIDITLSADAVFDIYCFPTSFPNGAGYYSIDVPTNSLKIYDYTRTLVTTGVIPFTLVAGRKYTVSTYIIDWLNIFEIKDSLTSDVYALEYQIETSGLLNEPRQNERYKFYVYSGATTGVKLNNLIISTKKNPLVLLMGDSITEGALFTTSDFDKRFSILLRKALKGNVIVSARGGANWFDINQKIPTEVAFVKADYTMLTIGTNGGLDTGQLTGLINDIITAGSIPIINHVPTNNGYSDYTTTNTTIDSVCASTGAIRGCLFDVATALGNVPSNGNNTVLFNVDGIHPNTLGQQEMFKRFEIDLPFLFT